MAKTTKELRKIELTNENINQLWYSQKEVDKIKSENYGLYKSKQSDIDKLQQRLKNHFPEMIIIPKTTLVPIDYKVNLYKIIDDIIYDFKKGLEDVSIQNDGLNNPIEGENPSKPNNIIKVDDSILFTCFYCGGIIPKDKQGIYNYYCSTKCERKDGERIINAINSGEHPAKILSETIKNISKPNNDKEDKRVI
jgi:hypothetical protein